MTAVVRLLGLVLSFSLVGCGQNTAGPGSFNARSGTLARVKAEGQVFNLKITDVTGPVSTVVTLWDKDPISSRQLYRGIYEIAGTDLNLSFTKDFDPLVLDELFPLEVGKEIAFKSVYRLGDGKTKGKSYEIISVTDRTRMTLKHGSFEVYEIEIETELELGGRNSAYRKTIYYAPEIGMILKTVHTDGRIRSSSRALEVKVPDAGDRNEGERNIGTVII